MKYLLLSVGSVGDIHPFLAISKELKKRGHQVTFIGFENFKYKFDNEGIEFISIASADEYDQVINDPDLWHPYKGFKLLVKNFLALLPRIYKVIEDLKTDDTVIIASGLIYAARIAREYLKIPLITIHLQPAVFFSVHLPAEYYGPKLPQSTPKFVKRFALFLAERLLFDQMFSPELNDFRKKLGLPPEKRILSSWIHSPDKTIGLFPEWYAPPQPDWPSVELTGFLHYEDIEQKKLPDELSEFINRGAPPIVFTFGTAMARADRLFKETTKTCIANNLRAIFLTPFKHQIPDNLPDNIIHCDFIPLNILLPFCSLLVYHGGMGTLAQALKAGIPHLVIPHAFDQPDNAARLKRIGVGDWLKPKDYNETNLYNKLMYLLDSDSVKENCVKYSEKTNFSSALENTIDKIESIKPGTTF